MMVGKSSIRGIAGEQKERRRGEQQRPEGKDPGEMSTTDKTREPQETEESKKKKEQMPEGECLYGCHRRKEWEALIRKTNQFIQKTRHTSSKKKNASN